MINKKFTLDNYEINSYVREQGNSLNDIYFSHANGFNALAYSSLIKNIDNDYQIIAYDMRGHGSTTLPAKQDEMKSWFIYKDDLEKILEIKKTPSILIGHSMGGKTAMTFDCIYPERVEKLVVVDISPKYYPPHHQEILSGLKAVDHSNLTSRKDADQILSQYFSESAMRQFLLKNLYWRSSTE